MPYLLSIDTTSRGCSVALHQDTTLLSCFELRSDKSSSAMLTTLIEQVVRVNMLTMNQLDAIVIAKGPGSYTGLRIGVSTAKGLCYALDKPLISVNSLTAMAKQLQGVISNSQLLCPMIDARRMEVYCQLLDTQTLEIYTDTEAKIIDKTSFEAILSEKTILFFGDGAAKCKDVFADKKNAFFLENEIVPSAKTVGELAYQKYLSNDFENLVTFEPFYLKEFMATTPKKVLT